MLSLGHVFSTESQTIVMLQGSSVFLLLGVGLVSIAWFILRNRRSGNSYGKPVPGSMGWPIVGHLPYISTANPYPFMNYYVQKYGPIFRLKLGSWDAIVLSDYHQIKKALNNVEFTSRPSMFFFLLNDLHGIVSSSGPLWTEQRRFALRQLRDLGMGGTKSIESHILREAQAVTDSLRNFSASKKAVDLHVTLNISITNIIWAIVAGKRMEYDDPKFVQFVKALNKGIELSTTMGLLGFVPWLVKVLPAKLLGSDLVLKEVKSFHGYAEGLIREHRSTLDPQDPRDYIDHFLIEQEKNPDSTFTDKQLVATVSDLFNAGGETTATTLRWAIFLLAKYPAIQEKLQNEIDQVIGKDRLPCIDDQNRMPYALAIILEVLRFGDLVPSGLFHNCEKDTTFEGFHIPKGSLIMPLQGYSHRSSKFWSKPYEFCPEHFLEPDGQLRQNVEGFFPFSIGRRICIGERLARAGLFIFLTQLYQQFNIRLDPDSPEPSLEADPRSGLIRWPHPHKVILEQRSV